MAVAECSIDPPPGSEYAPVPALYNLSSGAWKRIAPLPDLCADVAAEMCEFGPTDLGAEWIEYVRTCEHCADYFYFQNIWTGATRALNAWRPGGTTFPDLDSAQLPATLCAPLRVPFVQNIETPGVSDPGPIVFFGGLAVDFHTSIRFRPVLRLERCGTGLLKRIVLPTEAVLNLAANPRVLMWIRNRMWLEGVFRPSLRRFVLSTPVTLDFTEGCQVALSWRTIYLFDSDHDQLWGAPAPAALRASP